mmetsp:Transcript_23384/g.72870  ORF Transcript_23384/g.72870 Transcript_23384/m.72870 type:complete len:190 (-) Transcript_23384:319-888(-)
MPESFSKQLVILVVAACAALSLCLREGDEPDPAVTLSTSRNGRARLGSSYGEETLRYSTIGSESEPEANRSWQALFLAPLLLVIGAVVFMLAVHYGFGDSAPFQPPSVTLALEPMRLRAMQVPGVCEHVMDFYAHGKAPHKVVHVPCCKCNTRCSDRTGGMYHCPTCRKAICNGCAKAAIASHPAVQAV